MKQLKIWSILLLAVMMMPFTSRAQEDYSFISGRSIFPIVNNYAEGSCVEFIAAELRGIGTIANENHYNLAEKMWLFKESSPILIDPNDFGGNWFVSFHYISQTKGIGINWNSGSHTNQFAFHPGKHYNNKDVLYAFLFRYGDDVYHGKLYLVDITNKKIVALLADNFEGLRNGSINVFANLYNDVSEMLVITDDDKTFLVYNEIPSETNGVNAVNYSGDKQEVYNISGVKIDKPQTGVNIVNGKKYVSK